MSPSKESCMATPTQHSKHPTPKPTPTPIAPRNPTPPPYANHYVKVERPKRYPKPTLTPIAPRYPTQPPYANHFSKEVKRPKHYKAKSAEKRAKTYSPKAVWNYTTPGPEPVIIAYVYPPLHSTSIFPLAKSKSTQKSKS